MKVFKYVAFLLSIVIIGTAIYIAVQPNEFSFSRSRIIPAPTSVVFNKVNDLKNWPEFVSWMEQEPDVNLQYGDTTSGVGASVNWNGKLLSTGALKTLTSNKNQSISQHIVFADFKDGLDMQWVFEPAEGGTKVTWSLAGKQDFKTKLRTVASSTFEETNAADFERGLHKLENTVVADMKKYSITINGITDHSGGFYLFSTTSSKIDYAQASVSKLLPKISQYAKDNFIATAGAPFVRYLSWDITNNATILSASIPTTERVITTDGNILTGELPAFTAIKTTLKGDHSNIQEAWELARKHATENQLELVEGLMLETYVTGAADSPNPADWITHLYLGIIQPIEPEPTTTE
jgi:ribosome-associated toxin RatA of RatAB toxin-antitoxin module